MLPAGIPISGAAGDQQAALFGQTCFEPGMVKATFGTGAFILMHTGTSLIASKKGLLTTIAWGLEGKVEYALEGSVFVAGAAVQWLSDGLGIIQSAAETGSAGPLRSRYLLAVLYFVPSFVGLGRLHWNPYVRGMIMGITEGVQAGPTWPGPPWRPLFTRRKMWWMPWWRCGHPLTELKVDGGASVNNFLCQFMADMAQTQSAAAPRF